MKRTLTICLTIASAACIAAVAQDKHDHDHAAKPEVNPPFDSIKKLAGEWCGTANTTDTPSDTCVTYRVVAAGSAVMETLFQGTDHEMVTMYHMDGKDLVLTHYCSAGNQPHMKLKNGKDANVLTFECTGKGSNMKESDAHMHKAVLTIVDDNHIKSTWIMLADGKPTHEAQFDLMRKKA